MTKGYWVARVDVTDEAAYKNYVSANAEAFTKYGAKFLVRGGTFEAPEGVARSRNVVLEFPSYQAALDCYHSPEYAKAKDHRLTAADSELIILDGYDGPQPGV